MIYALSAIVLGLGMILTLSVPLCWRVAAALVWAVINTRQLQLITRGHKRCRRIRIASGGTATMQAPDGRWFSATILHGSVVLRRIAWLRFAAEDGQHFAELMRRKYAGNEEWRRLQVIWRHLGAGG